MLSQHHVPWPVGAKRNHHGWGRFRLDNADEVGALLKKHEWRKPEHGDTPEGNKVAWR